MREKKGRQNQACYPPKKFLDPVLVLTCYNFKSTLTEGKDNYKKT